MLALFGVTKDLVYNGGRGRDVVLAYGGELHGGRGDDAFISQGITHYDGGSGFDAITYAGDENLKMKKGITISLADSSLNTGEAKGDTYNSVEKVIGSKGHDTIYGNNGANTLLGMEGNNTLIGGKGKDTLAPRQPPAYSTAILPSVSKVRTPLPLKIFAPVKCKEKFCSWYR